MNCKKCGSQLNAKDLFCKHCGEPVRHTENNKEQPKEEFEKTNENKPAVEEHSANNMPTNNAPYINNQQPVYNNQPYQQPMYNNMNMPQNYPNNPNPYNYQPMNYPRQNNDTGKYLAIGIVGAIVIIGILFIIISGSKGSNVAYDNNTLNNGGGSTTPTPTSNTGTNSVKYGGFTYEIPKNMRYEIKSGDLLLGDEYQTWEAGIQIVDGQYDTLKMNKSQLIPSFQQNGYTASNLSVKSFSGKEFVTLELVMDGEKAIVGYSKATSTKVYAILLVNINGRYDYSPLINIGKILNTAQYTGDTRSIEIDSIINIDQNEILATVIN